MKYQSELLSNRSIDEIGAVYTIKSSENKAQLKEPSTVTANNAKHLTNTAAVNSENIFISQKLGKGMVEKIPTKHNEPHPPSPGASEPKISNMNNLEKYTTTNLTHTLGIGTRNEPKTKPTSSEDFFNQQSKPTEESMKAPKKTNMITAGEFIQNATQITVSEEDSTEEMGTK